MNKTAIQVGSNPCASAPTPCPSPAWLWVWGQRRAPSASPGRGRGRDTRTSRPGPAWHHHQRQAGGAEGVSLAWRGQSLETRMLWQLLRVVARLVAGLPGPSRLRRGVSLVSCSDHLSDQGGTPRPQHAPHPAPGSPSVCLGPPAPVTPARRGAALELQLGL